MKNPQSHFQQSSRSQGQSKTVAVSKIARILTTLLSGISLNRFEAERIGDHCLHSTVSVLGKHGLVITRHYERVPNGYGDPCNVKRYRLPTSEHDNARKVLAYLMRVGHASNEG